MSEENTWCAFLSVQYHVVCVLTHYLYMIDSAVGVWEYMFIFTEHIMEDLASFDAIKAKLQLLYHEFSL